MRTWSPWPLCGCPGLALLPSVIPVIFLSTSPPVLSHLGEVLGGGTGAQDQVLTRYLEKGGEEKLSETPPRRADSGGLLSEEEVRSREGLGLTSSGCTQTQATEHQQIQAGQDH